MKRYIYTLLFILGLTSCEKKSLPLYEGPNDIYFIDIVNTVNSAIPRDSIFVTFGYLLPDIKDSVVNIAVGVTGKPVATDRPFNIKIDETSGMKEGVHFELNKSEMFIPANKVQTNIQVKLKRAVDLKTTRLALVLNLMPNEHFSTSMKTQWINKGASGYLLDFTRFKITAEDVAGKPPFWENSLAVTYLGPYSPKKMQLLVSILNLDVNTITDVKFSATLGILQFWKNYANAFLLEEKAKDIFYYEEDGVTLIKMGL